MFSVTVDLGGKPEVLTVSDQLAEKLNQVAAERTKQLQAQQVPDPITKIEPTIAPISGEQYTVTVLKPQLDSIEAQIIIEDQKDLAQALTPEEVKKLKAFAALPDGSKATVQAVIDAEVAKQK